MTQTAWIALAGLALCAANAVFLALLWRRSSRESEREERVERTLREELRVAREEASFTARALREEVSKGQQNSTDALITSVSELGRGQLKQLETVEQRVGTLTESNETRLERLRSSIETQLHGLRQDNEKKLEAMRQTVDEKLQGTLEKRLGESFGLVSTRLEAVAQGLGEMRNLATGVGDLKRVLTNVKTRGTFGEVQLEALLEQVLTPDQFARNVATRPQSAERVEFAVRLPGGSGADKEDAVWLPIDAKFPQEDYQRLVEASEQGHPEGVAQATRALITSVRSSARSIQTKYLDPPHTTDFAILFLPTEGLFAEVLRQPGLVEELQARERIVVAGPTTLTAMLSSLRMGFRTLAIERRSSEVWTVLSTVKTEFGKFGEVLDKVKKQLSTASNTIDETGRRTRAMERKLRAVETLPEHENQPVLGDSDET
jgi:DNA recombination protein RmuC